MRFTGERQLNRARRNHDGTRQSTQHLVMFEQALSFQANCTLPICACNRFLRRQHLAACRTPSQSSSAKASSLYLNNILLGLSGQALGKLNFDVAISDLF